MLQPSRVAQQTGYRRPNRLESAKAAGLIDVSLFEDADYPAPLVLPNDEIDFDPEYPPQSFSDWQKHITPMSLPFKRTKIYLVPPPGWTEKASFSYRNEWPHRHLLPPGSESIVEYLAAFYDGFEVLQLRKEKLTFDEWIEEGEAEQSQSFVALNTGTESIRIRKRPMPNKGRGFQLNLNDLLDGAIAVLPDDALALILLMDFDLYEDDDDDFVCGRAYGESQYVSCLRFVTALHVTTTSRWILNTSGQRAIVPLMLRIRSTSTLRSLPRSLEERAKQKLKHQPQNHRCLSAWL